MDPNALVNDQLEAGRRLLRELRQAGIEIAAAFWAKPSFDDYWHFYLVAPGADTPGAMAALLPIVTLIDQRPELGVDFFDVRIIGPSDAMGKAAVAATAALRSPGITRYRDTNLGGVSIDGAYLYPPAQVAA
jgi:hypothetical protein